MLIIIIQISEQTVVCSQHFKSEDFKWTPIRKTLKPGSVPSVFAWKGEVTPRREIPRYPLPQKRPREENKEVFSEETCETVHTDG